MHLLRLRRAVFIVQWFAPVPLVLVIVLGRVVLTGLVAGGLRAPETPDEALLFAVSLLVGLLVVVLPAFVIVGWPLYVPAVLTVIDRAGHREGRVRGAYAAAVLVQWVAVVPASLAVPSLWRHSSLQTLTVIPLFGATPPLPPVVEAVGAAGLLVATSAFAASAVIALLGAILSWRGAGLEQEASRTTSPG